jgi:uncharacterized membrane protein (Fun14 family)
MTHVLACAMYCNSDGTLNSGGTFLAHIGEGFVLFVIAGFAVKWFIVRPYKALRDDVRRRR